VATKGIANDCIALIGESGRPEYAFAVFDRCTRVRLGRWRVDPKSGDAAPLGPE
jgi:hypothetical protein